MIRYLAILLLLLVNTKYLVHAQVKIGDNPTVLNGDAILELEGANKGFILSRVALVALDNPSPMTTHNKGMVVYNTLASEEVPEGLYINDGERWQLLGNSTVSTTATSFGSGAPSGACTPGTLYTDTLSTSPTVGRQWTCSGGAWKSYTPSSNTPFVITGTNTDAAGNKWASISRFGHVNVEWTNGTLKNSSALAGGHLVLTRETDWAGGYIDFKRSAAQTDPTVRLAYNTPWNAFTIAQGAGGDENTTVYFKANGRVGIGKGNPDYKLDVNGGIGASFLALTGNISALHTSLSGNIEAEHGTFRGNLSVGGTATKPGGGDWSAPSDIRSKENIESYNKGLSEIMGINPVSFQYKKSMGWGEERYVGTIAQEVEKVLPSVVKESKMGDIEDFKQVDPSEFTYLLINAVKELKLEIDALKKQNAEYTEKLASLENQYSHTIEKQVSK